jgi:subtilisin-like proprotein convertase family protein
MKKLILLAVLHLAASATTPAALLSFTFNSDFENGGNIPDGNVNPWSDTRTLSGIAEGSIADVTVRLNLSGGFNGDLYGYLSYNGVLVPLVNRVGVGTGSAFGYADAGLNVTFTDGAANNIHFYQSVGGYSISGGAAWQPDGRTINPVTSPPEAFDAPGTMILGAFRGMNPNGSWTLALADVSDGGGQTTVVSWGLDITAVPEPANTALFVVLLLLGQCGRECWVKHRRGARVD